MDTTTEKTLEENIEDLRNVQDLLHDVHDRQPEKFNMDFWGCKERDYLEVTHPRDHCKTAACFAGWCCVVIEELQLQFNNSIYANVRNTKTGSINAQAIQDALGLTHGQAWGLCYGNMKATAEDKAEAVGHIIKDMLAGKIVKEEEGY